MTTSATAAKPRIMGKGEYDAVATNRNRRVPTVEFTGEDSILDARKRALAQNVGRDLERNYSPAKAILHQFRLNVVGALGKLQVNADNGDEAAAWFNEVWAKDCDYRDDVHWSTMCANVVANCEREGDMLAVFDDAVTNDDTGKLLTWESDQIVNLVEGDLNKWPGFRDGYTQDLGIVRDNPGRVVAYIATGKRGGSPVRYEEATIYPRAQARMPKNPWRLNQGRGVASMLASANNFQDLYEIFVRELQTAKRAAGQYGFVKRGDAVTDYDSPSAGYANLPENNGKTSTETAAEGANSTDTTAANYERLESFLGGAIDYMDGKDEVVLPSIDRPNVHLPEFAEAVLGYAGASVGLARAYTMLRADSSYTAFRGDMILSWATFYLKQKWLERAFADWVGVKALGWAMRKRAIPTLPAGWERALSWSWPTMPEVDELDAQNAVAAAFKNGTTNFAEQLGPDWRRKLQALADQVQYARELGLPLRMFEMASGGIADNPKKDGAA